MLEERHGKKKEIFDAVEYLSVTLTLAFIGIEFQKYPCI